MQAEQSHWHVLGAGAIGSLFAHQLAAAGCRVTLIPRGAGTGHTSLTLAGDGAVLRRRFALSPSSARNPIDQLLVTTKAMDVDPGIAGLAHRLHPASRVLVIANGMGFAGKLPHGLVAYRGSTTEGAYREAPTNDEYAADSTRTVHAGRGLTHVGLPGGSETEPDWFTDSWGKLANCSWDGHIERRLWRKLAINCVINPLTATSRCRNGELLAPAFRAPLETLCDEVASACRALGQAEAAASLLGGVLEVASSTAGNRSSMLQDVLHRRSTEIDFINGFLLRQPAVAALELPLNHRLIEAVRTGRQLQGMP